VWIEVLLVDCTGVEGNHIFVCGKMDIAVLTEKGKGTHCGVGAGADPVCRLPGLRLPSQL